MHKKRWMITSILGITAAIFFGMLYYQNSQINAQSQQVLALRAPSLLDFKANQQSTYPLGDVENVAIFIEFKDDPSSWLASGNEASAMEEQADSLFNSSTWSFRNYMKQVSYDHVNVHTSFFPIDETSTIIPYQVEGYDSFKSAPLNDEATQAKENKLLGEALAASKSKIEELANVKNLDVNQDGYIDSLTFIIKGRKYNASQLLWPHQYQFKDESDPNLMIAANGTTLKASLYNVVLGGSSGSTQEEAGIFNATNNDLGVICHEYLHMYGYPDLYHAYKINSSGTLLPNPIGDPLGRWDIMDITLKRPQFPLIYTTMTYAGWKQQIADTNIIQVTSDQRVTLGVSDYEGTDTKAAKIFTGISDNALANDEYIMVEYRKQSGWDAQLPGEGLIVYRINTKAHDASQKTYCGELCGNLFGTPDEVYMYRKGIQNAEVNTLSGNDDENLNYAALRSGDTLGAELTSSAKLEDTIYFSDGSNTGIVISDIKETANGVSFQVTLPKSENDDENADVILREGNIDTGLMTSFSLSNGTKPYHASVESIKKDGSILNSKPFRADMNDSGEQVEVYIDDKGLKAGLYELEVAIEDSSPDPVIKKVSLQISVRNAYPPADEISFQQEASYDTTKTKKNAKIGTFKWKTCENDVCPMYYHAAISYRLLFDDAAAAAYFNIDALSGEVTAAVDIPAGSYAFDVVGDVSDDDTYNAQYIEHVTINVKEADTITFQSVSEHLYVNGSYKNSNGDTISYSHTGDVLGTLQFGENSDASFEVISGDVLIKDGNKVINTKDLVSGAMSFQIKGTNNGSVIEKTFTLNIEDELLKQELVDVKTKVKVKGSFDSSLSLQTELLETNKLSSLLKEDTVASYVAMSGYQVSLMKDGLLYQNDEAFTLYLPLNDTQKDKQNLKLVAVYEDNTYEMLDVQHDQNYISARVKKSGKFIIVSPKEISGNGINQETPSNETSVEVNTSDVSNSMLWILMGAASFMIVLALRKKVESH